MSLADDQGDYYQALKIEIRRPAGPLQIIEAIIIDGFTLIRVGGLG